MPPAQQAPCAVSCFFPATCIQVPATPSSPASPGGYDVFVIPDPLFRGSLEDNVASGCSYYDLLRIGFASAYLNMRVLESVQVYTTCCGRAAIAVVVAAYQGSLATGFHGGGCPLPPPRKSVCASLD